jgi:hypothetical protein
MNRILLSGFCVVVFLFFGCSKAQGVYGQGGRAEIIAFYNLENLFDTIDTPGVNDFEFTPEGTKKWDTEKYWAKVDQLAKVLAAVGADYNASGPAVFGLCEMENKEVLNDLVKAGAIRDRGYEIIHYNSPDERGIDVALLYQPDKFVTQNTRSVPLIIRDDEGEQVLTRDQLVVTGLLNGEEMHFILNHWPSRYGGEESSRPFRIEAARLTRTLADSILAQDKKAKIIIMGDLNDDPNNESILTHLKAPSDCANLKEGDLFNATGPLFESGQGSLLYRGVWNLFDQIIVSQPLLKQKKGRYFLDSAHIFKEAFLLQQEGKYKGYTWRTYVGNNYHGGFSDHLPSYIVLRKK